MDKLVLRLYELIYRIKKKIFWKPTICL